MSILRVYVKALIIVALIVAAGFLIFSLDATAKGFSIYSTRKNQYDTFLTEGAYFRYYYSGDQYGKGSWEDYHWWFTEEGVFEITKIEGDLVYGQYNYTRDEEDNEYYSDSYTCYATFVYNITNNTYIEDGIIKKYFNEYSTYHLVSFGPWFYHVRGMTPKIQNDTFSFSETKITVFGVPINVLWGKRSVQGSYVDDGITFYGVIHESYYFDNTSGLLIRYTINYPDMWDAKGKAGWSYTDEYVITETNVKLSIAVGETESQIYSVFIIFNTQPWAVLLIGLVILLTFLDVFATNVNFTRTIHNIANSCTIASPKQIFPIEFEVYESGWLRDGFVIFKRGSESHVIVDLNAKSKQSQHSISTDELYPLEKMLAFEQLDDDDIKALNAINSKYNCLELNVPAKSDPILIQKLKFLGQSYNKEVTKVVDDQLKADELLNFAYEIYGYRKILSELFGQAYALPPFNVIRAWKIYEKVRFGRVLLVGDDDFISLLLATLGLQVSVIDIDPYVLRMLRYLSLKYRLDDKIELYYQDIRNPFALSKKYAAVHMDPGYSLDGLLLFISRGLYHLMPDGYLFLSWNIGEPNRAYLEKALKAHNVTIEERVKTKLKYLLPVAGYYSHHHTKYGSYTTYVPPSVQVGTWTAGFYVGTLKAAPTFVVDPVLAYTGVLY